MAIAAQVPLAFPLANSPPRTMYRVLAASQEVRERRNQRKHPECCFFVGARVTCEGEYKDSNLPERVSLDLREDGAKRAVQDDDG